MLPEKSMKYAATNKCHNFCAINHRHHHQHCNDCRRSVCSSSQKLKPGCLIHMDHMWRVCCGQIVTTSGLSATVESRKKVVLLAQSGNNLCLWSWQFYWTNVSNKRANRSGGLWQLQSAYSNSTQPLPSKPPPPPPPTWSSLIAAYWSRRCKFFVLIFLLLLSTHYFGPDQQDHN